MSTLTREEFGPGYDHPNRKFHFWAVILPMVLIAVVVVALLHHTDSQGSHVTRSPVVSCPKKTCPPPGSAGSAKSAEKAVKEALSTTSSASSATVLGVTLAMLSHSSSAATHAAILSSA
jgi:hypothetical protein